MSLSKVSILSFETDMPKATKLNVKKNVTDIITTDSKQNIMDLVAYAIKVVPIQKASAFKTEDEFVAGFTEKINKRIAKYKASPKLLNQIGLITDTAKAEASIKKSYVRAFTLIKKCINQTDPTKVDWGTVCRNPLVMAAGKRLLQDLYFIVPSEPQNFTFLGMYMTNTIGDLVNIMVFRSNAFYLFVQYLEANKTKVKFDSIEKTISDSQKTEHTITLPYIRDCDESMKMTPSVSNLTEQKLTDTHFSDVGSALVHMHYSDHLAIMYPVNAALLELASDSRIHSGEWKKFNQIVVPKMKQVANIVVGILDKVLTLCVKNYNKDNETYKMIRAKSTTYFQFATLLNFAHQMLYFFYRSINIKLVGRTTPRKGSQSLDDDDISGVDAAIDTYKSIVPINFTL